MQPGQRYTIGTMPLSHRDRHFLQTVERLKIYLLLIAGAVFLYLLFVPSNEIQMTTSVVGFALCGIFWLTQRLLSLVSLLDLELTRLLNAVKRVLPEDDQKRSVR